MKLRSILLLFVLLLISKAGMAQTEHTNINRAWAALNKAYRLRNETIMNLADTMHNRKTVSTKDYNGVARQVKKFAQSLNYSGSLTAKRISGIVQKDNELAKAFGKLILISGPKSPDHRELEDLEALENRINLYKRLFNDACKEGKRTDLIFPTE